MQRQGEEHLSSLLRICSSEEARVIRAFFGEARLSDTGERAFCKLLELAQEYDKLMQEILQRLQEFLIGDLSWQGPATRGDPRAPGYEGIINTAFFEDILRELKMEDSLEELTIDDLPLAGFPVAVPGTPFRMETFYGDVYYLEAEASDGARFIYVEDGPPLNFTRCKLPDLTLGKSAVLYPVDAPTGVMNRRGELAIYTLQSLQTVPIISLET